MGFIKNAIGMIGDAATGGIASGVGSFVSGLFGGGGGINYHDQKKLMDKQHEIELIEFTGQQDINKADVFVGDYFDTEDGLMEVYFIDGKFILMWADTGTYRCDLCDAVSKLSRCGNKYENHEMLSL